MDSKNQSNPGIGERDSGRMEPLDLLFDENGISPVTGGDIIVLTTPGEHTKKYLVVADGSANNAVGSELFESFEHLSIGDNITLTLPTEQITAPQYPFTLPNGLQLTYGQIVALGGDFFGVPSKPISDGDTPEARVQRFNQAFSTLGNDARAVTEVPKIFQILQTEIDDVEEAIRDGQDPHVAYDQLGLKLSIEWCIATNGRYLKLAYTNWDHFGQHAVSAYIAGHTAALAQAVMAGQSQDTQGLELAYAMNAFADHYLSDLFSSGHLRTPRKELYDSAIGVSAIANYCAKYMHDEDCKFGLDVQTSDDPPDTWRAYGDRRYFDTIDVGNRNRVGSTVQASADEVWEAYSSGTAPSSADYSALTSIPDLFVVQTDPNRLNYAPLFIWDASSKKIKYRTNINDLNSYDWSDVVSFAYVYAKLTASYNPNNPSGYLTAPQAAPAINAWQSGGSVPATWGGPSKVRYCYSYTNGLNESYTGPWSDYVSLDGRYYPTLAVPTDPSGIATGRNVFRQFDTDFTTYVGSIEGNVSTAFVDNEL
ncbi:hypothetical protein J0664_32935 (plasmid) [Rhizobium leguminosarum]|uniref:hypothetical protein n=1 Tax=Rhizobium leguminosarum TaxID=384 RepID=UPI001A93639E|nr:hypothetical protein [Rhizobium leguminosarum]MBY5558822.1 phospholipase [Rhizobium leguminosarum]QSW27728.1 hypothetical protein J0664_32935 [Rhizobium leguminosarum]